MTRFGIAAVLLFACATAAGAQTLHDEQVWLSIALQKTPTPQSRWRVSLDGFARTRDWVSDINTTAVRPSLTYQLTPRASVTGGYLFALSYPPGGSHPHEHRLFGQFLWTTAAAGGRLTSRTRLEGRFLEHNSGPLGRLRQQLRYSHPIGARQRWAWVLYDELLIHTNDTTLADRGFAQNRAFGGLSVAATSSTRVECGYMNQFIPGRGSAANKVNHALSCSFGVAF